MKSTISLVAALLSTLALSGCVTEQDFDGRDIPFFSNTQVAHYPLFLLNSEQGGVKELRAIYDLDQVADQPNALAEVLFKTHAFTVHSQFATKVADQLVRLKATIGITRVMNDKHPSGDTWLFTGATFELEDGQTVFFAGPGADSVSLPLTLASVKLADETYSVVLADTQDVLLSLTKQGALSRFLAGSETVVNVQPAAASAAPVTLDARGVHVKAALSSVVAEVRVLACYLALREAFLYQLRIAQSEPER